MRHRKSLGFAAEAGQAAVEYALIIALVAAGLVLAYASLGATTLGLFISVITAWSP